MTDTAARQEREAQIAREHRVAMMTRPDPGDSWLNGYRDDVGYLLAALDAANSRAEKAERRWQEQEHPFDASEFKAMAARIRELEEALRENVGDAYNLLTQGESPLARRQPAAQRIYDRSRALAPLDTTTPRLARAGRQSTDSPRPHLRASGANAGPAGGGQ